MGCGVNRSLIAISLLLRPFRAVSLPWAFANEVVHLGEACDGGKSVLTEGSLMPALLALKAITFLQGLLSSCEASQLAVVFRVLGCTGGKEPHLEATES